MRATGVRGGPGRRARTAAPVDSRTALAAVLAAAMAAACGGGGGGGGGAARGNASALAARIDRGTPELAPADGYTGSAACLACHADVFREHERTAHHRGLRATDRPGVSGARVHANLDGRGRDDFRTGLDLASTPAFAMLGAAAPRLSFAPGEDLPYRVTIGAVAYPVERVYGGRHREAYLLRAGPHLVPAPFEFDLDARAYAATDLAPWYAGTAPRFATAAAAAAGLDPAAGFERSCAGCHVTGLRVEFDGGRWRAGFAEVHVGCESCHGPGVDHVLARGDASRIVNPRRLDDGTPDGRRRADAVCGQCHARGTGAGPGPEPLAYPWSAASGGFRPDDALDAFLRPSADPADHWGFRDAPLASAPTPSDPSDDAFLAARAPWMQAREHAAGGHSPDRPGAPLCIDCHSAHERTGPSQLRTQSAAHPDVRVSSGDGSLCLDCHAGRAPFADATGADPSSASNRAAVARHMAEVAMPVAAASVDPAGTGVGSCVTCHMPSTVVAGRAAGTDAAGFARGPAGHGTHTMRAPWPSASEAHGVTNACNACHPVGGTDAVARVVDQWRRDGADGDGVHHGAPARRFQSGRLGDAAGAGAACVRCHTTEGFRAIVVAGDPGGIEGDADARSAVIRRAVLREEGITCAACHGAGGGGDPAPGAAPALRLPRANACAPCHGDGVTFDDHVATGEAPHAPQQGFVDGTAGAEPPGGAPFLRGFHAGIAESCVHCHFDRVTPSVASHSFEPSVDTCRQCHPAPSSFDLVAFGDYDGDGTVEGLQTEVTALLALLRDAILAADPLLSHDGERFSRGGVAGTAGATEAVRRAAFNWESVHRDGSLGIHDPPRIVGLLQRSFREVTGADVPGATLR